MRPYLTLHHPAQARRYYAQGAWQDETLYALLARHAAARPDAPALQDGRRRLSFGEVLAGACGAGTGSRSGCRTGSRR